MERKGAMNNHKQLYLVAAISLIIVLSCNLPRTTPPANQEGNSQPTSSTNTADAAPSVTPTYSITHITTPGNISLTGTINYDVESSGTGPEHRAPYGDVYRLNRFERPFTKADMTYLPNVDIVRFRITSDQTWDYVFIELIGTDPNDPLGIDYGVELDQQQDGFGEYLIWAHPPYTTTWSTTGVSVLADTNHDSAGLSAEKSDAPFSGNGYDKTIFDQGKGDDPDLAWTRLDPSDTHTIEFAFKRTLPGNSFMWNVWADAGMKKPEMFSYNDRYTATEAGSPQTDNSDYPIKALYAMDSTCRAAFGFVPNGYEPLICPVPEQPTKRPPNQPPPPAGCQPPPSCTGQWNKWHADTCTCETILY